MSEGINQALSNIQKKYGKGSVMNMSDKPLNMERLSTGIKELDEILGGGIPFGRIVEVFGVESGGKTTISLHIINSALKQLPKKGVAFIDAEHSLNPLYAQSIGIDLSKVIIAQPDYGEQALDILEELIRSGDISVVVVDSVAALTPKAEIEGEMSDAHIGRQARMMGQALRKITSIVAKTNTIVIFVNQLREKIGVMFGDNSVTPGGKALKFYSSIRLDVRNIGREKKTIKGVETVIGQNTRIETKKNKTFPPFKKCEIYLSFGEGVIEKEKKNEKTSKKK